MDTKTYVVYSTLYERASNDFGGLLCELIDLVCNRKGEDDIDLAVQDIKRLFSTHNFVLQMRRKEWAAVIEQTRSAIKSKLIDLLGQLNGGSDLIDFVSEFINFIAIIDDWTDCIGSMFKKVNENRTVNNVAALLKATDKMLDCTIVEFEWPIGDFLEIFKFGLVPESLSLHNEWETLHSTRLNVFTKFIKLRLIPEKSFPDMCRLLVEKKKFPGFLKEENCVAFIHFFTAILMNQKNEREKITEFWDDVLENGLLIMLKMVENDPQKTQATKQAVQHFFDSLYAKSLYDEDKCL